MSTLELRPFLRRLSLVVLALCVLLVGGTIAYVAFEDVSTWNGFLWALDTIATEGARNRPDTVGGESTWVVLIVLGVGTLLYALVTLVELLVSGRLRSLLDERREQRAIDSLNDHVIICGYGRVGRQVARDLRAAGERYVVIDARHEHAEDARHIGVRFIEGSASDDETLEAAGIERARAVIACVDSDAENVFIVLSARQLNTDVAIIARASTVSAEPKLLRAGATRVISPYRTSGTEMARAALTPQVSGAMDVTPEYRLEEIEVEPGSPAEGRTIGDVRGDAIIVGVRHADGSFLPQPPGDTGLQAADVILALGQLHTLERLENTLGPRRSAATA
jgi:voltage-gated potassium channel